VKRDWEQNGKVWIDESCFSFCWNKIWRWLDLGSMLGLLMKHEIVKDEEDFFQVNNPNKSPREKANNLLVIVRQGGDVSFYLLYMCIRDDSGNPLGHRDAVKELVIYGECSSLGCPVTSIRLQRFKLFAIDQELCCLLYVQTSQLSQYYHESHGFTPALMVMSMFLMICSKVHSSCPLVTLRDIP